MFLVLKVVSLLKWNFLLSKEIIYMGYYVSSMQNQT